MLAFRPAVIAGVCAGLLTPAASAAPVDEDTIGMRTSQAELWPPHWRCPHRVTRPTGAGDDVVMAVSVPHLIPGPLLLAQLTTGPAKGKPDYDKKVCEHIDIRIKLKRALGFEYSQKGIVSGSWWPGTARLHCDSPGTVDVTIRYIDTDGNKRVIHRTVRCSQ